MASEARIMEALEAIVDWRNRRANEIHNALLEWDQYDEPNCPACELDTNA